VYYTIYRDVLFIVPNALDVKKLGFCTAGERPASMVEYHKNNKNFNYKNNNNSVYLIITTTHSQSDPYDVLSIGDDFLFKVASVEQALEEVNELCEKSYLLFQNTFNVEGTEYLHCHFGTRHNFRKECFDETYIGKTSLPPTFYGAIFKSINVLNLPDAITRQIADKIASLLPKGQSQPGAWNRNKSYYDDGSPNRYDHTYLPNGDTPEREKFHRQLNNKNNKFPPLQHNKSTDKFLSPNGSTYRKTQNFGQFSLWCKEENNNEERKKLKPRALDFSNELIHQDEENKENNCNSANLTPPNKKKITRKKLLGIKQEKRAGLPRKPSQNTLMGGNAATAAKTTDVVFSQLLFFSQPQKNESSVISNDNRQEVINVIKQLYEENDCNNGNRPQIDLSIKNITEESNNKAVKITEWLINHLVGNYQEDESCLENSQVKRSKIKEKQLDEKITNIADWIINRWNKQHQEDETCLTESKIRELVIQEIETLDELMQEINQLYEGVGFEWGHLIAHSLIGNAKAQVKSNLVLMTKHCNSQMIHLEQKIKAYALAGHEIEVTIHVDYFEDDGIKAQYNCAKKITYIVNYNGHEIPFIFYPLSIIPPEKNLHRAFDAAIQVFSERDSLTQNIDDTMKGLGLPQPHIKKERQPTKDELSCSGSNPINTGSFLGKRKNGQSCVNQEEPPQKKMLTAASSNRVTSP